MDHLSVPMLEQKLVRSVLAHLPPMVHRQQLGQAVPQGQVAVPQELRPLVPVGQVLLVPVLQQVPLALAARMPFVLAQVRV
jgi:hypothetical protein